jgi:hypothetical protein
MRRYERLVVEQLQSRKGQYAETGKGARRRTKGGSDEWRLSSRVLVVLRFGCIAEISEVQGAGGQDDTNDALEGDLELSEVALLPARSLPETLPYF